MKELDADALRLRWEGGEKLAILAAEVGLSRSQLWRRIGMPDAPPVEFVTSSALRMSISPSASDDLFIAWAAGFFDGEGCVSAGFEDAPKGIRSHLAVIIAQTVPEPLAAIQARWGGSLRDHPARNPRHRHQWRWVLTGKNAAPFLRDVLPHLRVKHEVSSLALEYIALIHQHAVRLSAEDHALRRPIVEAIRALNRPSRSQPDHVEKEVA